MNSSLLSNPTKSLENTSRNLESLQEQVNFQNSSQPTQLLLQERNESVEKLQINENLVTEQENNQFALTPSLKTSSIVDEPNLLNLHSPYYQKLSENDSQDDQSSCCFITSTTGITKAN